MSNESVAFKTSVDVVKNLPNFISLSSDTIIQLLESTFNGIHETIEKLRTNNETDNLVVVNPNSNNAFDSIGDDIILCLICNKRFKVLTSKHLAKHGLTRGEYKSKFGLPYNIKLVCKTTSERHRDTAIKFDLGGKMQEGLRKKYSQPIHGDSVSTNKKNRFKFGF